MSKRKNRAWPQRYGGQASPISAGPRRPRRVSPDARLCSLISARGDSLAGQPLLRLRLLLSNRQSVHACALGAQQKRDLRFASTASDRTASGVIGLVCGDRPLASSAMEADRPHTQGELARRDTFTLCCRGPGARSSALPPLDQPPHALGGMPGRPWSGAWPLCEVLRPPRARQAVPRGLDQRLPQVLVACLGDRAPAVALPAESARAQADPCDDRAF